MEEVLQGIPKVVVYLDDILAASDSEEEHENLLDTILSWIEAAGLRLRKSKCYLGFPLSPTWDIKLMLKAYIQCLRRCRLCMMLPHLPM